MEKQYEENFAANLKRIRRVLGMSHHTFGKFVGISGTSLHHLENGRRLPNFKTLIKIMRATKFSFERLTSEDFKYYSDNALKDEYDNNTRS